jgi:hypothetical protein
MKSLVRRVRRVLRAIAGQDVLIFPDTPCRAERLGSDYGGWSIAPAAISSEAVVYSFGIGEDISFDLALIKRFGIVVHAFDPTPRSIAWVHRQDLPASFRLHGYGLADFDGEAVFAPPADPTHVSHAIRQAGTGAPVSQRYGRTRACAH